MHHTSQFSPEDAIIKDNDPCANCKMGPSDDDRKSSVKNCHTDFHSRIVLTLEIAFW